MSAAKHLLEQGWHFLKSEPARIEGAWFNSAWFNSAWFNSSTQNPGREVDIMPDVRHPTEFGRARSPADAGCGKVVFPMRMNLAKLARSRTVAEAFARARAEPIVTVCPEMLERDGRRIFRIPPEAGYGVAQGDATALRSS